MFATVVSGLSGISAPSIFATFFTVVVVLFSITTSSVNVFVPPFAFTSTSVHVIVFVALSYPVVFSFFILVPAGITSVTVTFPSAFPLFVNVIVYVNVSPTFAVVLSTLFVPVMFATFVSVSGVSVSPTIATFVTLVFVSWFTFTSKLTVISSPAGTVTFSHVIVPSSATTAPSLAESAT